jgi:mannosylglycerate hydrolase
MDVWTENHSHVPSFTPPPDVKTEERREPNEYHGFVVSHTHWDRAWYLPFQAFRLRLVRLIDRLLELLEEDADFRAFTLDGQTVLLEDYLEIRPDQEERLRRLIEQERLQVGPWYTLPDLFLAGGEAVVRNLQRGREVMAHFGGEMPVGYIPDPFGHFAQMPQLLRGFGLDTYFFMRGMSAEMKKRCGASFRWEAPDGSSVLALYQRFGYFPVAALGHPARFGRHDGHASELRLAEERLDEVVEHMAPLQNEEAMLLSAGFDHMPEQRELPELLAELNEARDDLHLEHAPLPAFAEAFKKEAEAATRETVRGDLLGNADHPILQSVYSARLYLKQQNHHAQHRLVRRAEPLSAWMEATGRGENARPFLEKAWTLLLKNHPHDDLCGCSVDAVHLDDEQRYRQIREITGALCTEHLEGLLKEGFAPPPSGRRERGSDVWVFNPHPFRQRVRVEASVLFPHPDGEEGAPMPECPLAGRDADGNAVDVAVRNSEGGVMRSRYLEQTWGRRYDVTFEVDAPPLGYQLVHVFERESTGERDSVNVRKSRGARDREGAKNHGRTEKRTLENEHYRATVEDGELVLREKETGAVLRDVPRFAYRLDAGDTYSFGPVPDGGGPWHATLEDAAPAPDRPDTLRLAHRLRVPARYDRDAGAPRGETTLHLTTDLWLSPHRALAMTVRYDNIARDGRLRAVLPTGLRTDHALADHPFRLAQHAVPDTRTPEDAPARHTGYPGELDYATRYQGDFALVESASRRTWVANRGLPEYELMGDDANEARLAVTLCRAVSHLSVEGGRIRQCQAGPSVPTPGAQCQRRIRATLALGTGALGRMEVARHARAFAHPAWAQEMPHLPHVNAAGSQPRAASLLHVDNPAVDLAALRPSGAHGACAVRLCNLSGEKQTARLRLGWDASRWCRAPLTETWNEAEAHPLDDHALTLTLAPHRVQTVMVR